MGDAREPLAELAVSLKGWNSDVLHRTIHAEEVKRSLYAQLDSLKTSATVRLERERPVFAESALSGLLKTPSGST